MSEHPFDRVTEEDLRRRASAKWRVYPSDVLPAWVAEMDYPIAEPIKRALHAAVDADDAGYADPRGLGGAFAPWARRRWGWDVSPSDVRAAPDVVTAISELLLVATRAGDGVVIEPPVYPPFAATIARLGRRVVETPLARTEDGGYRLDLDAVRRAYGAGAKAHVLCSPHNPTGTVHPEGELRALAAMAREAGVLVLSDEVHAALTYDEATHAPFPTVSEDAQRTSIVLTSASKTYNLAGLKAAVMVATHDDTRAVLARLAPDLGYHVGHLGILGGRAAFTEGDEWLARTRAILDRNRALVAELLDAKLPGARYRIPQAGYLAWIDCTELGLGEDPAKAFLERGRVSLSPGVSFGAGGEGFARLNFATTRALLEEAVERMRRSL